MWLYAHMLVAEDEPDLFEVYKWEVGQFLTCSCSYYVSSSKEKTEEAWDVHFMCVMWIRICRKTGSVLKSVVDCWGGKMSDT